ncbi:hypothetical protein OENI_60103 [Oenococcus oeni]|uniref:Uncharacterized protein n=1 Tax=Oenococcus oeni TaxID=1247 RepID=A0AAQ2USL0_OENOE|nr:hypothetical protein OENI_10435 [Oenococcus oeni]SYV99121.1 hypothetical protein OENI_130047 [Oenococcus oeni]SYW02141.1 hypothetical protein OENI_30112 [Oenococcus oeni]SYW05618.1 hypothetical protein OENI_60103 [Oenococcus oeni]SYW08573.1 hypothetical protein OENI_30066 [Oenococcus oeni]
MLSKINNNIENDGIVTRDSTVVALIFEKVASIGATVTEIAVASLINKEVAKMPSFKPKLFVFLSMVIYL